MTDFQVFPPEFRRNVSHHPSYHTYPAHCNLLRSILDDRIYRLVFLKLDCEIYIEKKKRTWGHEREEQFILWTFMAVFTTWTPLSTPQAIPTVDAFPNITAHLLRSCRHIVLYGKFPLQTLNKLVWVARIWKAAVVAYFRSLSQQSPKESNRKY
jgi:hypothetical protein